MASTAPELNKNPTLNYDLFTPERCLIQVMNYKELKNEYIKNLIGGAYEHYLQFPHLGWEEDLKQYFSSKF